MEWFRWYHGTVADPKFSIIAKRSKQPRHVVIACWPALLEFTSSRNDRGSLDGIDLEEVSVVLDLELDQVVAVYDAMVAKGMIEADRICNWEKRQPVREDETAKERKERWKEKQALKAQEERNGTHEERNGTHEERNVTHGTCKTLEQTLEKKEEQIKPKGFNDDSSSQASTTPLPPTEAEESSSLVSINEFRGLFHQNLGTMMPGGCNEQASALCRVHSRQKIKDAFEITAMQGGKTLKYVVSVLEGKPKPQARGRDSPESRSERLRSDCAAIDRVTEAIYAAQGV